jgi:hypothetical protein
VYELLHQTINDCETSPEDILPVQLALQASKMKPTECLLEAAGHSPQQLIQT